jgi:acetyltransferase-like isoleucine patch superfamily enzyme
MPRLIRKALREIWVKIILKYKIIILRLFGAKIGKGCYIYTSLRNFDKIYTDMIKIGNNVTITKGVILLCHDMGKNYIYKRKHNNEFVGKIKIGNNCFIGMNSIILPNVIIGNNVVIGAGSIVSKNIRDNVIVAGNPAKIIKIL